MYKIIIKDKYQFHCKDKFIAEFNTVEELEEATFDYIRVKELYAAIKFMCDTTHNVAEFGGRGYFTVSYYAPEHDE